LSTSEEREQFIEQFWLRRSSNPDLPENDLRKSTTPYCVRERALRFRYPGWKTDRGRTYIIWGPADEVDFAPDGRTYDRR